MTTKRGGKILLCALCIGALNTRIQAVVDDSGDGQNPYRAIWLRNAFDLKPADASTLEATKPNLPPPNVQLTGITTMLGDKRALFLVQEPSTPGKPPGRQLSYILTEGERRGGIEVLEINMQAATVKIKNDGILSIVALETNRPAAATVGVTRSGAIEGVPRARASTPQRLNPNFAPTSIPQAQTPGVPAFAPQNNSAPPVSQAGYAQPVYQGGFQTGYAQPQPATTSAPNPGSSPVQAPPAAAASPTRNQPLPEITPEMQAVIAAAEAAAADGSLAPPPLPAGVSVQTSAAAQAGAPPPPNFPPPPPLPANIMSLIK